jgi:hypothetical protein
MRRSQEQVVPTTIDRFNDVLNRHDAERLAGLEDYCRYLRIRLDQMEQLWLKQVPEIGGRR